MAGLYIHVPFCVNKCNYCDFISFAGREKDMETYIERLCEEMHAYRGRTFDTVFIGGGTPSCLSVQHIKRICDTINDSFVIKSGAEMSCEMNPGSVTDGFLKELKAAGFNRGSMGMQAKGEHLLKTLGRIHNDDDVHHTVALLHKNGFRNVNIDLMFGIPGQTDTDVQESLNEVIKLGATHVSCYGLIVEEGTPIERCITSGELALPNEEQERAMYDLAIHKLSDAGYRQYEVSNFAKPGFACRHNIGYWRKKPYLGVGLSAHSYESGERFYNTSNFSDYLNGFTVEKREVINEYDSRFETLMLGLRMNAGVRFSYFKKLHGIGIDSFLGKKAEPLIKKGLLEISNGAVRLTRRGMDVQNMVLVELMD